MTIHQIEGSDHIVYDVFGTKLENVKSCDPVTGQVWHFVLDERGVRTGAIKEETHRAPLEIGF